jgi:hypothetical protein
MGPMGGGMGPGTWAPLLHGLLCEGRVGTGWALESRPAVYEPARPAGPRVPYLKPLGLHPLSPPLYSMLQTAPMPRERVVASAWDKSPALRY